MIIEAYKNLTGSFQGIFMLRQILTILGLFAAGYIPLRLLRERMDVFWELLLSFPLGLSLYSVSGFLLLISGVRFCLASVAVLYVIMLVVIYIITKRKDRIPGYVNQSTSENGMSYVNKQTSNNGSNYVNQQASTNKLNYVNLKKNLLMTVSGFILAAVLAAAACSGLLSQYVSNDSVYYYSMYPSVIVDAGYLFPALDKFLTDVGQTTAVLQSLPFTAGFDETFGIQHFFNINFILIFFAALFESSGSLKEKKTLRYLTALSGTLFLVTAEPFIVLSKWVLSNVYFMDYLFCLFYLSLKYIREKRPGWDLRFIIFIFSAMLSMCRMEGGVVVFVLVMSLSVLPFSKKELICLYGIPLAVMEFGYYGAIYLRLGVDPLYSFLDIKTALAMAGLIILLFVYIIFFRGIISEKYVPVLLLIALFVGNLGLLVINPGRYIADIEAFLRNIRLGNGWGSFIIVIGVYCLIFLHELIKRRGKDIPVAVFFPAAMVFTIIAVCFERGGVLAVRTSDSGNRVLMEIVPLLCFSVFVRFTDDCFSSSLAEDKEEKNG